MKLIPIALNCRLFLIEQLQHLKLVLVNEFSNPFEYAKDLHERGILPKSSYLALLNFFTKNWRDPIPAKTALVNLLFEELVNLSTYEKFKDYYEIRLHWIYDLLSSMGGEYTMTNFVLGMSKLISIIIIS